MFLVLTIIAVLIVGYLALDWLRAGRMKRRLAAGHKVDTTDPAQGALNHRSDANVNWSNLGTGPHSGGGISGGGGS